MKLAPRTPGRKGSRDFYERYWTALDDVLQERTTLPPRESRFKRRYYAIFPVGPKGIHVAAVIDPPNCDDVPMRIELSLVKKELGPDFERLVRQVRGKVQEIDADLGPGLDWLTTTDNQLQIAKNFTGWDLRDEARWPRQHNVLALELQKFKDTFSEIFAS